MDRFNYLQQLREEFETCIKIAAAKNADYAQDHDPFANFTFVSEISGAKITTAEGIFVRMCDKFMRIANLLHRAPKVRDESLGDTLLDLANYSMIMKIWCENYSLTSLSPPSEPCPTGQYNETASQSDTELPAPKFDDMSRGRTLSLILDDADAMHLLKGLVDFATASSQSIEERNATFGIANLMCRVIERQFVVATMREAMEKWTQGSQQTKSP